MPTTAAPWIERVELPRRERQVQRFRRAEPRIGSRKAWPVRDRRDTLRLPYAGVSSMAIVRWSALRHDQDPTARSPLLRYPARITRNPMSSAALGPATCAEFTPDASFCASRGTAMHGRTTRGDRSWRVSQQGVSERWGCWGAWRSSRRRSAASRMQQSPERQRPATKGTGNGETCPAPHRRRAPVENHACKERESRTGSVSPRKTVAHRKTSRAPAQAERTAEGGGRLHAAERARMLAALSRKAAKGRTGEGQGAWRPHHARREHPDWYQTWLRRRSGRDGQGVKGAWSQACTAIWESSEATWRPVQGHGHQNAYSRCYPRASCARGRARGGFSPERRVPTRRREAGGPYVIVDPTRRNRGTSRSGSPATATSVLINQWARALGEAHAPLLPAPESCGRGAHAHANHEEAIGVVRMLTGRRILRQCWPCGGAAGSRTERTSRALETMLEGHAGGKAVLQAGTSTTWADSAQASTQVPERAREPDYVWQPSGDVTRMIGGLVITLRRRGAVLPRGAPSSP